VTKLIINRYKKDYGDNIIYYNVKLLLDHNIILKNGVVTNFLFENNFSEFYFISDVLDYLYVNSVDNKFCLLNYKHNIIKDIVGGDLRDPSFAYYWKWRIENIKEKIELVEIGNELRLYESDFNLNKWRF